MSRWWPRERGSSRLLGISNSIDKFKIFVTIVHKISIAISNKNDYI
nr:MAG TPA: hypothetical protein [Caudoviricetes sp.]